MTKQVDMEIRVAAIFLGKKVLVDVPPDFVGNPLNHGIIEPRGGGFSIMQDLQKDLHEESYKESGVEAPVSDAAVDREKKETKIAREMTAAIRQAMYWAEPGRNYRLTRGEQGNGTATCPQCKAEMAKERFTRKEKMYRCDECGFKVPSGNVTTRKIEIEVDPSGEVEVEITTAGLKPRRTR